MIVVNWIIGCVLLGITSGLLFNYVNALVGVGFFVVVFYIVFNYFSKRVN